MPIADPALTTAPLRSSATSSSPAASAATVVAGTRTAAMPETAKITAARAMTAPGPTSSSRRPGIPSAKPPSPESSWSLELASTSAASPSTTVGTIAAFATW